MYQEKGIYFLEVLARRGSIQIYNGGGSEQKPGPPKQNFIRQLFTWILDIDIVLDVDVVYLW